MLRSLNFLPIFKVCFLLLLSIVDHTTRNHTDIRLELYSDSQLGQAVQGGLTRITRCSGEDHLVKSSLFVQTPDDSVCLELLQQVLKNLNDSVELLVNQRYLLCPPDLFQRRRNGIVDGTIGGEPLLRGCNCIFVTQLNFYLQTGRWWRRRSPKMLIVICHWRLLMMMTHRSTAWRDLESSIWE